MVVGKLQAVDVAEAELDVPDRVLGCVAARGLELVLRIDADEVGAGELGGEAERDRARAAADVENAQAVDEVRKQEVGVDGRAPCLHEARPK